MFGKQKTTDDGKINHQNQAMMEKWTNQTEPSHQKWSNTVITGNMKSGCKVFSFKWTQVQHPPLSTCLCPLLNTAASPLVPLLLTPADRQSLWVGALLDQLVTALHQTLQLSLVTGNLQEPSQLFHKCPQVLDTRGGKYKSLQSQAEEMQQAYLKLKTLAILITCIIKFNLHKYDESFTEH